jgi:hypothetical protein
MLYELLQRWPAERYDGTNVITAVMEKLKTIGAFGDYASSSIDDADDDNGTKRGQERRVGLADCLALLLTQRGEHLRSLELRISLALAAKRRAVAPATASPSSLGGSSSDGDSSGASSSSNKRMESRAKRVFDYIDGHGLHMFLRRLVRPLIMLHADRALNYFVWHAKKIPVVDVAPQLQTGREQDVEHLHNYLRKVFERNPHDGKEYHNSHLEWLADHAESEKQNEWGAAAKDTAAAAAAAAAATTETSPVPVEPAADEAAQNGGKGVEMDAYAADTGGSSEGPLLRFLRTSPHYDLEKALEICQSKGLHRCNIYILGRMGRSSEALDVIFDELHDMAAAISFVKSRSDEPRLWTLLLERALAEPPERAGEYVGQLLTSAGQSVDPLMLIDRIPQGLEIPRMRDKLVMILREYSFATRMRAGCVKVAEKDGFALASESVRARRRAVCYQPTGDYDEKGQLTAERVEKPDTMRGASAVRLKRRAAAGAGLSSTDSIERAKARRQR